MVSTKQKIKIMEAYDRGEKIEARSLVGTVTDWAPVVSHPVWSWGTFDYRIASREPVVLWINTCKSGTRLIYSTELLAKQAATRDAFYASLQHESIAVKFVEVIS